MDCTHVSPFGAPMPFGCTAPAGAPAGSFPGAPQAPPRPGDVVETVGGVVGIVMQVLGPLLTVQTPDGGTEQVETADAVVTVPAPMDWTPILIGGGALVLVLVLMMGRR